jgi:hydroxypyruvate isomerase
MPKFSANISMLFPERPFLERFSAAAAAGFQAVEYVQPYEYPAEQIAELLHKHKLKQALFNMPPGDWAAGERGIGCLPDRVGEFQDGVAKVVQYAKVLECPLINCLAGVKPAAVSSDRAMATLAGNLRFAAAELKKIGVALMTEPINFHDIPGFFLNTSAQGIAAIDAAGGDSLKLQYDIYHMQRMEGELAETITRLMPRIGHFQIAGNPKRTEPDQGEINYLFLLQLIDRLGYTGWIGAEYKPVGRTEDGLGWLKEWST